MKKMDLHIHTVSTKRDKPFAFSIEKLKGYVIQEKVDLIAITNHNLFDAQQFSDITNALPIKVFPGISKDDLLTLLKIAISEESFEMDPYSTESVHNAAHQIIYKNIYQKFEDIRLHRVSFEDEKVNLYRTAINKYSSELSEDK